MENPLNLSSSVFVNLMMVIGDKRCFRQTGQDSLDELREKDFKRDLVERERQATRERAKDRGSRSDSKKSRLDQLSTTNLDADDPVDEEDSDDSNERLFLFDKQ